MARTAPARRHRSVPARVQQHVAERAVDLARGRQQVHVVAVGEHAPGPPCDAIHGPREPRADGGHAAAERAAIVRLDDEVRVIALERVVDEAEARTLAAVGEAPLDLAHDRHGAERRQAGTEAKGHVGRQGSSEIGA